MKRTIDTTRFSCSLQLRNKLALGFLFFGLLVITKISASSNLDSLTSVISHTEVGSAIYFETLKDIITKYEDKDASLNIDSLIEVLITDAIKFDSLKYQTIGLYIKARVSSQKGAYNKAISLHQESIDLGLSLIEARRQQSDHDFNFDVYNVIAQNYHELQNYKQAEIYLDSASISIKDVNSLSKLIHVESIKLHWAKDLNDYKSALKYKESTEALKDSLWSKEKQAAFNKMKLSFETKDKEQENILLASEKKLVTTRNKWISLFAFSTLMGFAILVFYRLKNKKQLRIINEQKQKLEKRIKEKNRFFANTSHTFRVPLSPTIKPLKQLTKKELLDENALTKSNAIAKNEEQQLEPIEEITDLSKHDRDQIALNSQPENLLAHLKLLSAQFELEAENRKIDFNLEYQLPNDLKINIDIKKLRKIILNILSNAFKFSRSNDTITLKAYKDDEHIKLIISDTGIGISQDDLPYIFDRFYQSKKSKNSGLGIGLHYAKNLIEMMNGNISVQSKSGVGSTFTIDLPKTIEHKTTLHLAPSPTKTPNASYQVLNKGILMHPNRTILIVEDNLQMQRYIQEMLSSFCNIVLSDNRKIALEELKTKKVDLIITDLMMPEMDGYAMLQRLKKNTDHQHIPAIILTATTDLEDKLKSITLGIDDYLTKPFEQEELIARVENILNNLNRKEQKAKIDYLALGGQLPKIDSASIKWLKNLEAVAFQKVTESNLTILQLAQEVSIGERQLNRKLKNLTGLTPGNYIKEIKLQKARQLLENQSYSTVAEISYLVGFSTPNYFSSIYNKRFGKLPSEYLKK